MADRQSLSDLTRSDHFRPHQKIFKVQRAEETSVRLCSPYRKDSIDLNSSGAMFTVFDESEIDDLAKKNEYKKIKVSLREEGRLSSYVKVNSLSVSPVMDGKLFSEK